MAEITAELVRTLREKTGLGMMECRKALSETQGDLQAAEDLLRKKGLAVATTKASRATKEGLIVITVSGTTASMVEVVCETDFCARNAEFQAVVRQVAAEVHKAPAGQFEATGQITQIVTDCLNKIRENMRFSRGVKIEAPRIATYLHHNKKVGVLLGVEGDIPQETLNELCWHIAFANPLAIATDGVPKEAVEYERKIATEQAQASAKPPAIQTKMIEGKVRKFLAANALLEQPFVRDEKRTIKQVLGNAKVVTFVRYAIGA